MLPVSDIQLASQLTNSDYTKVASIVVLFYDYVLTFGEEVEFVWKQSMSAGKILFLLNRYIPMIDLVILMISYEKFCVAWFRVDTWVAVFSIVFIDVLLLLRTWALWRRSRMVLIFLSGLLVLCLVASLVSARSDKPFELPSFPGISPCHWAPRKPDVLYGIWVSAIVFDSAIMFFTLAKVVSVLQPNIPTPLITGLLKDGFQYYIMIFLAAIANIVTIAVAPAALVTTFATFYRVIAATLGSRLILNLRGSILRPSHTEQPTIIELDTLVFDATTTHDLVESTENPEANG